MRFYIQFVGTVACGALALATLEQSAQAVVQVDGNVLLLDPDTGQYYADNPFSTTVNEGIPTNGNRIDPFRAVGQQIEFEGRPDPNGTPDPFDEPTADTTDDRNINFDIIVGRTSIGQMIINQSDLRDMDLIIGDEGMVNSVLKRGSGTVRIEGFGSLYNNDPTIIPFLGPGFDPENPMSPSYNPRDQEPGFDTGFDLYVGRAGNGVLQLALGGRAEIHDAVIAGNGSGSVGTLVIDGIDSFLQSGGLDVPGVTQDEVHYMIIGRLGSGTMSITNGGQSFNVGPIAATSGVDIFGAVIGSNFAADDTNPPATGGQGTVSVDGLTSKWTVGGNLQIGGFHDKRDGTGPTSPEDLEGNDVQYNSNVGRGTLNVSNGALVSIVTPPLEPNATNVPNRLDLLIGRFGRVELSAGGRIELLGAFDSTDPQNPTQRLTRGRVINDGVISGDGRISVLQFRNRVLGEVRVGAGEKLLVDASGGFTPVPNLPDPGGEEYPLSNYGLIEVLGNETARAEIEFERGPGAPTAPIELTRPFLNLELPDPPGTPGANGRTEAEIVAQDAILRFRSGIVNFAKVSFTGGTNVVSGLFDNQGNVFVSGDNTTVTFEDPFLNGVGGLFQLEPNISLVSLLDDIVFGGGGALSTTFGGRPTGQEISRISSAGDVALGGVLTASLFTAPGVPGFAPQAGDQFEIIHAGEELTGDFAAVLLPPCIGITACYVGFPDYALGSYFIRVFSAAAAIGADFDGNGIVDAIDLQIWRQNLGGPGPVGDANGDGIVDGRDFFIWQMQVGGPGMGAGSGAGLGSGTVPEPTSIALATCGGLLALALRRRRAI